MPPPADGAARPPALTAVVVGGGIAGLTAARDLALAGHRVTLLEEGHDVGGKLRRRAVGPLTLDVGAEAMLNRRPEGVDLATELGLPVVHPAVVSSRIWTAGVLRPLPRTLMGVPLDAEEVAATGILSAPGLEVVRKETDLPATLLPEDVSVGALVDSRFGTEVTDLLVEPLLGGVYAGHAREISARAAVPPLVELAQRGSVLSQSAGVPHTYAGPVFAGIDGGMGLLAERLAEDLRARGATVRTGASVRSVHPLRAGHDVVLAAGGRPEVLRADVVVLAVPPGVASRLLAGVAAVASAELARIESASTVVVTLLVRAADAPGLAATDSSGFLVPPVENKRIKAATFSFAKWGWVRDAGRGAAADGTDLLALRTSLGRHREDATVRRSDDDLVRESLVDLSEAVGLRALPVATQVTRWVGGLPQYGVGHLDRVRRIRADVGRLRGVAVCGAAYDGVGVPAVIASAHRAVEEAVAAALEPRGRMGA